MAFEPENDVEAALQRAARHPDAATELHRAMLNNELLVLGTIGGQENATRQVSVAPGSQLQLVIGEKDGAKYLPVFTSITRMQDYLRQYPQTTDKYLSANGRALLDVTRGAPVTLNPASELSRAFQPEEIARILDSQMLRGGPKINLGQEVYPPGFIEILSAVFAKDEAVAAAWMIGVEFADRGGLRHPLVGIETTGDMAGLVSDIEQAMQSNFPGLLFDVQRVDRKRPLGMADAMLQLEPFYERGKAAPQRN